MDDLTLPAPDADGEEWGRLAVSLPGWRWMPGMLVDSGNDQGVVTVVWRSDNEPDDVFVQYDEECPAVNITTAGDDWSRPSVDDPATAGCLLALLGSRCLVRILPREGRALYEVVIPSGLTPDGRPHRVNGTNLGRACIAAAAALGRWPGGTP